LLFLRRVRGPGGVQLAGLRGRQRRRPHGRKRRGRGGIGQGRWRRLARKRRGRGGIGGWRRRRGGAADGALLGTHGLGGLELLGERVGARVGLLAQAADLVAGAEKLVGD